MPATTDDRVDLLAKRCDSNLGDPDLWFRPDGYPHSLALCIIDSIASTGAHYTTLSRISCVTTSNIGRPKAAMRIPTMRELYWAPSQNLAVHSNGLR